MYSGGTNSLVNYVVSFLSQMNLLRWSTFLLGSLTVTLTVLLFCIYLFLLTLENSDHVAVSVAIDFPTNTRQDVLFHRIAYDYSCTNSDNLCYHLRDIPWGDIFKLSTSVAASELYEGLRLELMHRSLIISIRSHLNHFHGF